MLEIQSNTINIKGHSFPFFSDNCTFQLLLLCLLPKLTVVVYAVQRVLQRVIFNYFILLEDGYIYLGLIPENCLVNTNQAFKCGVGQIRICERILQYLYQTCNLRKTAIYNVHTIIYTESKQQSRNRGLFSPSSFQCQCKIGIVIIPTSYGCCKD